MNIAKTRIWVVPIGLFLLLSIAMPARCQILEFDFSSAPPSAPTTIDAHIATGDNITATSGFVYQSTGGNSGGYERIPQNLTPASGDSEYLSFRVRATTGYQLDLAGASAITLDGLEAGAGNPTWPLTWYLRSSIDNFNSDVASFVDTGSRTWHPVSFTLPIQYDGLTDVTFHIGVRETPDLNNSQRYEGFDNIALNGALTLVPEPYEFGLIGVIGLIGFAVRERFMRKAA